MKRLPLILSCGFLTACMAVKSPIANHYNLTSYSAAPVSHHTSSSLTVTPTAAVDGYETDQIRYLTRPFTLSSFAKSNWVSPPATMLYPLLIQSLQHSGYFSAVGSGSYFSKTTYRLDTQLIELRQNFTKKPSVLELKVKAVLTHVEDNQIIASRLFKLAIPCPQDTPYGGVLAANQATLKFTKAITAFVIKKSSKD